MGRAREEAPTPTKGGRVRDFRRGAGGRTHPPKKGGRKF